MFTEKTSESFSKYFQLLYANDANLLSQVYKIRYDVFCKELELEQDCPLNVEKDEFDDYSLHYLLRHKTNNRYAGTIRMVLPPSDKPDLLIPLEKYCLNAVDSSIINIPELPRGSFAEISRLAVPARFRKRAGESGKPYAVMPQDPKSQESANRRSFPHIATGLYLATAALCAHKKLDYVFVMIEPRLARALQRVGLHFEQMGEAIDYHGSRAPYYITTKILNDYLKPDLKHLYALILDQVETDLKARTTPSQVNI